MRMGWRRNALIVFAVAAALSGCAPAQSGGDPAKTTSKPAVTFTAIPTFTPAPPTASATLPPSVPLTAAATEAVETASGPLYVTVVSENVNLRTQPGTVFPVSRLLAKGTVVRLWGVAPGGEWLYVETDAKIRGWLLYWLVAGGHDGGTVPIVQPTGVQVIHGKIVDRAGVPISGIGFAVSQTVNGKEQRTDATSDKDGEFYAYLPADATGTWSVKHVSVSCSSNTMDAACNCIGSCGSASPESMLISLPASQLLEFQWR